MGVARGIGMTDVVQQAPFLNMKDDFFKGCAAFFDKLLILIGIGRNHGLPLSAPVIDDNFVRPNRNGKQ